MKLAHAKADALLALPSLARGGNDGETLLLTSDQVELQGCLAHKKPRPPRTLQ